MVMSFIRKIESLSDEWSSEKQNRDWKQKIDILYTMDSLR